MFDPSKYSDEELLAEYQRAKGGQQAKPQSVPPRQQGTLVTQLLDKINPALTNSLIGAAEGWTGKTLTPKATAASSDPYATEYAKQKARSEFKEEKPILTNEQLPEGFTMVGDKPMRDPRYVNPEKADREERLREFETRRQGSALRGELNQRPEVKRFQEINSAARGIDAVLEDVLRRPDNKSKNVGDQALITLYNKTLDPLSVVRESEYERTPEGQALLNRVKGYFEKVQAGGSGLTDEDRIEVARAAKILLNKQGEQFNATLGNYEELANAYGTNRDLVLKGYDRFEPFDVNKQYQIGQVAQQPQIDGQPQPTGQPTATLTPEQQAKRERLRQKFGV